MFMTFDSSFLSFLMFWLILWLFGSLLVILDFVSSTGTKVLPDFCALEHNIEIVRINNEMFRNAFMVCLLPRWEAKIDYKILSHILVLLLWKRESMVCGFLMMEVQ